MWLGGPVDHSPPELQDATRAAAAALTALNISFELVGNVGTRGIELLVGRDAFDVDGQLVCFKPGVPIAVGTVQVQYVTESLAPRED